MGSTRDYIPLEQITDLNLRSILYRMNDAIAQLRVDLTAAQAVAAVTSADAAALEARVSALETTVKGILYSGFQDFGEIGDPQAPGKDTGRLYARDNGSGKSQLVVRFNSGAVQVIATEP